MNNNRYIIIFAEEQSKIGSCVVEEEFAIEDVSSLFNKLHDRFRRDGLGTIGDVADYNLSQLRLSNERKNGIEIQVRLECISNP